MTSTYTTTRLSPQAMARHGWVCTYRGLGKHQRWSHCDGWLLEHCGHPTALHPWALYAPNGRMILTGADGKLLGLRSRGLRLVLQGVGLGGMMEDKAKHEVERFLEFEQFTRKLRETRIAEHLSDQAIMLMFLALGKEMWR